MTRQDHASGGKAVVLLHGRGGSSSEMLALLTHAALDHTTAIAPQAPHQSWWPTSFLAPQAQMERPLHSALEAVDDAVAKLAARGFSRDKIFLCGFSQGACLALEAYARGGDGLGGVLAFSGGLIGTSDKGPAEESLYGYSDKSFEYPGRRTGRVWISVHNHDPHIPLKRAQDSARTLEDMGSDVTFKLYPGRGHALMQDDLAALRAFLAH